MTVKDVLDFLWTVAPPEYRLKGDNVGFLCGRSDREVTKVLIALDPTEEVAAEAAEKGCELVVTHHPLIYRPAKAATDQTVPGRRLLAFAERGLAVISMHTNLDCTPGGVNDALAARLALARVEVFDDGETPGLLRIGEVPEQTVEFFLRRVKTVLRCPGLRYVDGGRPIRKVAVGGGACADFLAAVAAAGCDAFVTADVKYHEFLDAKALGLTLIDAGHFETENPVTKALLRELCERFPDLTFTISEVHASPVLFA